MTNDRSIELWLLAEHVRVGVEAHPYDLVELFSTTLDSHNQHQRMWSQ